MDIELVFFMVIILVVVILGLLMWWQDQSLKRIKELLEKRESDLPDERYFDLKYRIQFLTFAAVLIVTMIGLLGYSTVNEIKAGLRFDLYEMRTEFNKELSTDIDSTIQIVNKAISNRIESTNLLLKEAIQKSEERFENSTQTAINNLNSARAEIDNYNEQLKGITNRFGYKEMYVINRASMVNNGINDKRIDFNTLGIKSLNSIPTVFIAKMNEFDYSIIDIDKEFIDFRIEDAQQDSIIFSLLIFTTK